MRVAKANTCCRAPQAKGCRCRRRPQTCMSHDLFGHDRFGSRRPCATAKPFHAADFCRARRRQRLSRCSRALQGRRPIPVSYTHLDVYKRQGRDRAEADGVAVGRRLRDRVHADIAAGAALVVDVELFAQPFRQLLRNEACDQVTGAAGRERHDDADRPRGVGLLRRCVLAERGAKRGRRGDDDAEPSSREPSLHSLAPPGRIVGLVGSMLHNFQKRNQQSGRGESSRR